MKFTEVAPATKPVPVMASDVPPVIGPVVVPRPDTVGTVGDQAQLFTVNPVPQYTTHLAVVGRTDRPRGMIVGEGHHRLQKRSRRARDVCRNQSGGNGASRDRDHSILAMAGFQTVLHQTSTLTEVDPSTVVGEPVRQRTVGWRSRSAQTKVGRKSESSVLRGSAALSAAYW